VVPATSYSDDKLVEESITRIGASMAKEIYLKLTYCTNCKRNVEMINISYNKLANNRLAIEGYCITCSGKLLKTRVMPKYGVKKKKLKLSKRRGIRIRNMFGLS
jgi:hypothetical protein